MRVPTILALAAAAALASCGVPPNQRLLTRTGNYLKAMSYSFDTGHPFDIDELQRKFPELKGIVLTAPQWIEEYDVLRREAEARGAPIHEYRIPFGTHLTIEVAGEPTLTRTYYVPPSGYVHYPYLQRLKVAGLTPDELKASLEKDLSRYLREPEVLVHINLTPYTPLAGQTFFQQSFGGAEIIVMGAARSRYFSNIAYTGKETLVSVLGNSDLPPDAEWRQIRIIRRSAIDPLRKARIIVCDLWDFFAKADVRQDVPLMPGDVIYVPIRWSTDDQFWEDWGYVKRVMNDVFFLDEFRDGIKKGGDLRK
jgi:protein involved in polysaccharide export with SLBB domain